MPDFGIYAAEVKFVLAFIEKATLIARTVQAAMIESITKLDKSPVTVADFSIQALMGAMLVEHFPHDVLVGEESSEHLKNSNALKHLDDIVHLVKPFRSDATADTICKWIDRGLADNAQRFWTLDPIDGTKGFIRKAQFAVALALIADGKVCVSILGCPHLDSLNPLTVGTGGTNVLAVRDHGAWEFRGGDLKHARRINVSKQANASQAIVLRSVESKHTSAGKTQQLMDKLGMTLPSVHMDSLAKHAVLAAGTGDIMLRFPSSASSATTQKIWDYAPGDLIIEEAGGTVTDLDGRPYDFSVGRVLSKNRGLVATNGLLHVQVLETLKTIR